jgi:uncharacterized protein
MQRRRALMLMSAASGLAPAWASDGTDAAASDASTLIVAAWRGAEPNSPQRVGLLEADWRAREVRVHWQHVVPTRAHGFEIDRHGIVAVALRPGAWLMRFARDGQVLARARPALPVRETAAASARAASAVSARATSAVSARGATTDLRFNGHAVTTPDGARLYATMTDAISGRGWIGVHDAVTLEPIDAWASHGLEPHQLLLDAQGQLMVAHGGIHRGSDDRKVDLDRMDSSLVRIDARDGGLIGRWQLDDRRLSLRHIAWSEPVDEGAPLLLGVALQAEHDDAARRRDAPALAVWDGQRLSVPTHDAQAQGYAGDITAAHGGGFVISNPRAGQVLWWHPTQPAALRAVARLQEAYALTAWPREGEVGALVAAARGIGRWHPSIDPAMLPWPQAMALDNHWLRVA